MGQFSVKTYNPPGSLLSATQQIIGIRSETGAAVTELYSLPDRLILRLCPSGIAAQPVFPCCQFFIPT